MEGRSPLHAVWDALRMNDLLAALPLRGRLLLQQRRLPGRHHLPKSQLQRLAPTVVAERLEVEQLPAIADPAVTAESHVSTKPGEAQSICA